MALAPSADLFAVPSSSIQPRIDAGLVLRLPSPQRIPDGPANVAHHPAHPLAPVATGIAIAELERLARAGGRARRHRRTPARAVGEQHVGLDRGIAAGIEDLAREDVEDLGHGSPSRDRHRTRAATSVAVSRPGYSAATGARSGTCSRRPRNSHAASTNPEKRGWPSLGVDVNSG